MKNKQSIIITILLVLLLLDIVITLCLINKTDIIKFPKKENTTEESTSYKWRIVDAKLVDKLYIDMPIEDLYEIMGESSGRRALSTSIHYCIFYELSDQRVLDVYIEPYSNEITIMGFTENNQADIDFDIEEHIDINNKIAKNELKNIHMGMNVTEVENIIGKPNNITIENKSINNTYLV